MSKSMWIISILILILLVSSFWLGKNRETPPWMKCKESLFEQVVLGKCSPVHLIQDPGLNHPSKMM